MSLLNKASLIQIPSGYKDGTLYSAKPTNGDGDFTFSRGSNLAATRVNSEGLIEKGRENLLLQSNTFDTTWSNASTTETGGQTDKSGGTDAWKIDLTAGGGWIFQSISTSGVQTISVYAKAGTLDWVRLYASGSSTSFAYFDLVNGLVGITSGTIDTNIELISNGYYRIDMSFNHSSTTAVRIYPAQDDGDLTATSGNIYIQDAQLEQGLVATDYIETTTTTAQAGILEDMPRLDYSGGATCPSLILEPQRSNLVPYSENFLVTGVTYTGASGAANQAISPEGLQNAFKITEDSTNARHRFYLTNASSVSSGNVVISAFLKDGNRGYGYLHLDTVTDGRYSIIIDLSNGQVVDTMTFGSPTVIDYEVEDYGNGWYRAFVVLNKTTSGVVYPQLGLASSDSDTNDSGAPSYQGDGTHYIYCYGLQLEEGSYPTSYIPTYGASVTRNNDYMKLLATNFYSTTSYTYFLDVDLPNDVGTSASLWKDNDNLSSNGGFQLRKTSPTGSYVGITTHNGSSFTGFITNVLTGRLKLAIIYNNGQVSVYYNGVQSGSPISVTGWNQSTNHFKFEDGSNGAYETNQFLFIPSALTDQEAIALTTI